MITSEIDSANSLITYKYTDVYQDKILASVVGTLNTLNNTITIEAWEHENLRRLRQIIRFAGSSYTLIVNGGINTFYPSLGFTLIDKENNLWQYQN